MPLGLLAEAQEVIYEVRSKPSNAFAARLPPAGACSIDCLMCLTLVDDPSANLQATGVPLVDELMKLPSMDAAASRAVQLLAFLAVTAVAGTLLLRLLGRAARRRIAAHGDARFQLLPRVVAAAARPSKVRAAWGPRDRWQARQQRR